ncbi:MAG: hypothetical protein V3V01_14070, partial [Acidimicrobiales bacterium]
VFVVSAGCVFAYGLLKAVRDSTTTVQTVSVRCMEELQTNHARLAHKMEEWHETEITGLRNHVERMIALHVVEPTDRANIANTHAQERHHADELNKSHQHNDRMADLHESMAHMQDAIPKPKEPPSREPVKRSRAVKAKEAIARGMIPARH